MYTPPTFKADRAACLEFAEARGFATICAFDGRKPIASLLSFDLSYGGDGTPVAAFHVARHNPLVALADGVSSWLLAISGADTYVSPDRYVSPDQVPTWLSQAVSEADHAAIASPLLQRGDEAAQTIGQRMVALRPTFDYNPSMTVSAD
jgi:predicted FMN-binding regulatory protein PaiB